MADNLEVFEALEEEIDIDSEVEVQEYEEVKDYDDFEEKITAEDFIDLDNVDQTKITKKFICSKCLSYLHAIQQNHIHAIITTKCAKCIHGRGEWEKNGLWLW